LLGHVFLRQQPLASVVRELLGIQPGARELLSTVQRRAVGGRRVLILSYHRVVKDFALEEKRSLASLNIAQDTFRRHLEVLQETHDIVPLDDALSVLDGSRAAARDVAVITFDDGYRDVYTHAFPVMCDMRVPAVVYVPSELIGTIGGWATIASTPRWPACASAASDRWRSASAAAASAG